MKSVYSELKSSSTKKYDSKNVATHVKLIRRCVDDAVKEKLKYKLFLLLSRLVIKGINNFNYLTKNVPEYKILHGVEDLSAECYLVMEACLRNVKEHQIGYFYFYYNSGLNRAIYRLFEHNYQKHFDVVENNDQNSYYILNNSGYNQSFDTTDIELSSLTDEEKAVLEHKLRGDKLRTFLKQHNIKSSQFYSVFETLKVKLKDIYHFHHIKIE